MDRNRGDYAMRNKSVDESGTQNGFSYMWDTAKQIKESDNKHEKIPKT